MGNPSPRQRFLGSYISCFGIDCFWRESEILFWGFHILFLLPCLSQRGINWLSWWLKVLIWCHNIKWQPCNGRLIRPVPFLLNAHGNFFLDSLYISSLHVHLSFERWTWKCHICFWIQYHFEPFHFHPWAACHFKSCIHALK